MSKTEMDFSGSNDITQSDIEVLEQVIAYHDDLTYQDSQWAMLVSLMGDVVKKLRASSPQETEMDKRKTGLFHKFDVRRVDGSDAPGGKHDGCEYFVLDVTHDPHARAALRAYADSCRADYPLLARDLDAKHAPQETAQIPAETWDGFTQADYREAISVAHWTCGRLVPLLQAAARHAPRTSED